MSRRLAGLLGHEHPLFAHTIAEFERVAGSPGVDTRLIADCHEKSHAVMRQLGLDPKDTTAAELYHALCSSVRRGKTPRFFQDTMYVLHSIGGNVVSLNLQDCIESAHHELPFAKRRLEHARRHLRAELIARYADFDRLDNAIVHKLAREAGLKPDRDKGHVGMKQRARQKSDKPSILAIGDVFTDAFIKLDEAYAVVEKDKEGEEWLKLPFGSKPPYERVDIVRSVGPSPNAAVSCARLGFDVRLMSWLGNDEPGKESLHHLSTEGIDTSTMITEKDKQSSYWYVLRYGADRTMLVKSESYRYEWQDVTPVPDWVYLSYIGADSFPLHEKLLKYLDRHPHTKLAFQPGTYHFEWGVEKLRFIYKRSHIIILNREEAVQITGGDYDNVKQLAQMLHALGPTIVVITDGKNGSYALYDDTFVNIPNYPDVAPPLDRTGAGDAFASTIVAALALGETMDTALLWAPINSMNVVQQLGAQGGLQTRPEIDKWLKKAPTDYKITKQ